MHKKGQISLPLSDSFDTQTVHCFLQRNFRTLEIIVRIVGCQSSFSTRFCGFRTFRIDFVLVFDRVGQNVRLASKLTGYDIDVEVAKAPEKKKKKNVEDSLLSALEESEEEEEAQGEE